MKHFLLTVLGSLLLAPASFAIADSNNNGLSDLWEKAYNTGQLFSESFDMQADPDADGWTNAQEAAAGTNPFDPNPPDGLIRPEIAHIPSVLGAPDANGVPTVITPEAVTVAWPTLVGKQYTLLFSPDLTEGSWIRIGDPFIGTGDDPPFAFQVSDSDKRFWRVAVQDVDSDGDGLNDAEEFELGSSTSNSDSDGDGLPDAQEFILGTAPNNSDSDGDGISDAQEVASGHDPKSNQSFPPRWVSTLRRGATMATPAYVRADWDTNLGQVVESDSYPITVANLVGPLAGIAFPPFAPDAAPLPAGYSTPSGVAGGYRDAWGGGELSQARCWLQSKPAVSIETKRTVLRVTTGVRQPWGPEREESTVVEAFEVVIPANATQSAPIDLLPTFASLPNVEEEQQITSLLVPVEITVAFGLGPEPLGNKTSRELLEEYLESIKVSRIGDTWFVKFTNPQGVEKFHGVEIVTTKEKLIDSLKRTNQKVIFDGHSNFGLGPNLSGKVTHKTISDFTHFGVGKTSIPKIFRGSGSENDVVPYTNSDGTTLPTNPLDLAAIDRVHSEGWAYLTLEPGQIVEAPQNYQIAELGIERFKNVQGVAPGSIFTKQGNGFNNEWHFDNPEGSRRIIVQAPSTDVPTLSYTKFFYNACNTGRDYIENFKHGDFFYTKDSCKIEKATTVFVQCIIEGKSNNQIITELNQNGVGNVGNQSPQIYGYKAF